MQHMTIQRRFVFALLGACTLLCRSERAHAYSVPEAFAVASDLGGGGGRWFTGSPAEGFGCGVCHQTDPQQRRFQLHTAGLPAAYLPATTYEVTLDWPEFAARWRQQKPDPTRTLAPDAPQPGIGLVAEFVAESGQASGALEIEAANPNPEERCERVRENLVPRLGVRLIQLRPGVAPFAIKAGDDGKLRCEAQHLGQRCLIALSSCGARRVRVRWSTPSQWQGPIWFAAGFVASEVTSGTAEHDSVHDLALPMPQADAASGRYVSSLSASCAACGGAKDSGATTWAWLLSIVAARAGSEHWRRRCRRARS